MNTSVLLAGLTMILFGSGVFFYIIGLRESSAAYAIVVFLLAQLLIPALRLPFEKMQMNSRALLFLIIGGIVVGCGQFTYNIALRSGDVPVVVPIRNLAVLVTVFLSVVFLGDQLTPMRVLGVLFAVIAILLLSSS